MPSKAVPPRDSVQSAVSKLPETSTPREKIEQIVDVKNTTKLLKNKDQWAEITTLILSELSAKEKLEKKCADLVAKHTEDVKKAKAKAAAELKQKMSTAQAEHQAAIAALEETLQESKEQLEFLTQELAKAEVSATQAGKIAEMAAEEKEAARTRCTELETRTSELETANFNLLAHSEKQQKELSSLMDAAHTAKESAMEYKTANIRISHALEDATKKIAEMADLGNRLQTQHVVPRTPQVETNGQEGLGAPTSASSSSSSRPGSRGGKVKLTPLSNAREASEAPNVSPITGYQKWASYYGIEGESGGGVKRKDGDFAFLPGHQMSLKQQFNSAVCERFGCLIRGWRTLASYSEAGADSGLNLSEFTNACHELQLISAANTKMTFHEFARSFNGRLTLPDLDPEAYRVWSGLRLRLSDLFGSPQGGIREMFGPKDWLSTEDFLDCLEQIKLPKGKRLATYLAMDGRVFADCLVLSEKEIPLLKVTRESLLEAQRRGESLSPDAKRFLAREEQRAKGLIPPIMGTTSAAAQTKAASSAGPQPSYSPSAGMRRYQSYTTHGGDDQQVRGSLNGSLFSQNGTPGGPSSKSTGLELFENLKKLLVNKYRTLSLAWKTAFDLQGRGHCGSQEFAKVCRSLGFEGANTVWREVVGSGNDRAKVGGLLTYADLDPTGAKLIAEFKERMLERYRDFVTAWVVALDLDGSNRVPLEEWTTILCHQSTFGDYSEADARTLFRLLKSVDRKYLELRDIDVKAGQQLMDGTVPPHLERIKAETRKQVLGRSVSRERTSAFLGRQNSHEIQNLRAEIAQNQRSELNAKVERRQSRDMGAASKDEFLGFLKRKFGNVPRAWRVAFDKDGSGKVSQQEFFSTCRELKAFIGDIGKLFSELDVDGGGILSLAEMDPTAWKILEDFEEKCSVVLQQAVGGEDHGEASSAPSSAADDNKNEKSGAPRTRSNSLTARRNRSWWNVFFADQNIEERHTRIRMLQNASVTATICKIDFPKFQEFCQNKLNMHNEGSAKRIFKYFAADESSTFLTESDFKALDIPKMKETKLAKRRAGSVGGAAMLNRSRSSSLRGNADRDKSKMSSTSSSRWFNTGSGSASDSNLDHSSGREQGAFSTSDAENSKSEAVDEQVEEYGSFEPTTISRVLEESEQQVMDAVSEVKQEQDAENSDAAVAVCLPPESQEEVATKEKLDFSAAEEEHTRSGSAGSGSASASGEEIVTAASAEAEAAEQAGVPATAEQGVTEAGAAAPAPAPAGETSSTEAEVGAAVSSTTRTIAPTALGSDVITDVDLFCSTLVDSAEGDCGKAWSMLFKDAESLAEEAKFVDFGKAVRALKFQGNLKLLWTKVGGNEDNTLGPGDMEEALFF